MYYPDLKSFKEANGYEIEGVWYPRVTAIVSIKAKPALYRFYAEQESFEVAEAISARSAEEGTLIHEVVEGMLAGDSPVIPEKIQPVISAFQDFRRRTIIIPHQIEARIKSMEHCYAGTIDVLAEVNGQLGVLDIKTSTAIYRDYGMQTSAYVGAYLEDPSIPLAYRQAGPLRRWIMRLDQNRHCLQGCGAKLREKGGGSKVREAKTGVVLNCAHIWGDTVGEVELKELFNFDKDFRAFLAAKTLWQWENDYWLSKVSSYV